MPCRASRGEGRRQVSRPSGVACGAELLERLGPGEKNPIPCFSVPAMPKLLYPSHLCCYLSPESSGWGRVLVSKLGGRQTAALGKPLGSKMVLAGQEMKDARAGTLP